jgi:lipopolysaccharide/colanic/teichoic acid biosynthesis glycosyltransferase
MLDDKYRRQGDVPVSGSDSIPAPRAVPDFVAPVTLGRPAWQRRYLRLAVAGDIAALGCLPVLHLLWRDATDRPFVAAALSVAALSVMLRIALRLRLWHLRRKGHALSSVLAVGTDTDVADLVARTRRTPSLGWRITGVCTSTGSGPGGAGDVAGVPVVGDLDAVASLALAGRFDAVSVFPAAGWTPVRLRKLAEDLDCSRVALLLDPRLAPATGRDGSTAVLAGLPVACITRPTLTGPSRVVKDVLDRVLAALIVLVLAPVLLSCAVAVRRDGGSAFRRQTRVGRGGRVYSQLTFRTTAYPTGLLTPVGRVLRRWCLDELPQLFNVLGGSMALVGPRPMLPREATHSTPVAWRRRMLVKPGITGLSSLHRSTDLLDEEFSSADLRYVQQWSPVLDARILLKTVRTAWASER